MKTSAGLFGSIWVLGVLLLTGCPESRPLAGAGCPCLEGFACCGGEEQGVCFPRGGLGAIDDVRCQGEGKVCDPSGGPRCVCPVGTLLVADGGCVAGVECGSQLCSGHGSCPDTEGEISCQCQPGYAGARCERCDEAGGYHWSASRTVCTRDPCDAEAPVCQQPHRRQCAALEGRAFECRCDPGFSDLDEDGVCTRPAPTGLAVESAAKHRIALRWDAVEGASGYHVYRSSAPGQRWVKIGTSAGTAHVDAGLELLMEYRYAVSAIVEGETTDRTEGIAASTTLTEPALELSSPPLKDAPDDTRHQGRISLTRSYMAVGVSALGEEGDTVLVYPRDPDGTPRDEPLSLPRPSAEGIEKLDELGKQICATEGYLAVSALSPWIAGVGKPIQVFVYPRGGDGSFGQPQRLAGPVLRQPMEDVGLACREDLLVVGGGGEIIVYQRDEASGFTPGQVIGAPDDERRHFGEALALSADTLVVGQPWDLSTTTELAFPPRTGGFVHVFPFEGQPARIQPRTARIDLDRISWEGDAFGLSVAVHGRALVIGAPARAYWTGTAYLCELPEGRSSAPICDRIGTGEAPGESYGTNVLINESFVLVAGMNIENPSTAYLYRRLDRGRALGLGCKLPASELSLGFCIQMDGDQIAVSAPFRLMGSRLYWF